MSESVVIPVTNSKGGVGNGKQNIMESASLKHRETSQTPQKVLSIIYRLFSEAF